MAEDETLTDVASWMKGAKDGEEEFQLRLAQHYLKLADSKDGSERDQNGKLAVCWFVASSKQGNSDATKKLKDLVDDDSPWINNDNKEDVVWCVSTSTLEKKIRYAARNMFHTINSAQKEVLSSEEYSEAIKKLTGGREQKLLLAAGKKIGENISENEFVKILSRKIQGDMTLTSTERSAAYEAAGWFEKIAKYPKETASAVGEAALEFASRDGLSIVAGWIPVDQIYFLTLFFVYGFISPKFLLLVLPLLVFYISYATIIITTLQMFYKKRKLQEASALAEVLKEYDIGVDVDQTQSQYTWNSLTPYLIYFATIPLVVSSFSLADKTYIPCSELCVLNSILCGICFVAISDSHDLVTLLALFCNFLAGLPVFLMHFPEIPVVASIVKIISGNFVSLELYSGLRLNIGIPSLCYCLIPVFFIQMAVRKSFTGMYRVAVPHLVCYFWFELITTMYPFATWFGLARATVGYVMLPVLIPLSMFFVVIGGVYVFIKLLSSDLFGKVVITLLLGCIPVLLTQTKKLFGGKFDKRFSVLKKILMVMFAILAVIPLIFVRFPSDEGAHMDKLTAENFHAVCNADKENMMKCNALKGAKILWQGEITSMAVTGVTNEVSSTLDVFPVFISKQLRRIYGKKYQCDDDELTEQGKEHCKLMVSLGYVYGLEHYNKYNFNFGVKLTNGMPVSIEAGSGFQKTFLALNVGDTVEIKATISDALSRPVKLHLKKLKCLSRDVVLVEDEADDEDFFYNLFQESFSVAFNFFWYPLVEFVPQIRSGNIMEIDDLIK
ncbi:wolframin-like isoform X2 [Dreissena polymorpha]|uniref:wolframin-like isoform X2 n=1 Tax=Dreissena polymorpha TaxID=45954 RepID=UPI002264BF2E|nr:wolframin-like isoform X2 [Dreissena polymorpha]